MSFAPPQSISTRRQDSLIGLFVIVAVALVVAIVLRQITSQQQQWITLQATMSKSFGIVAGSPVKIHGVAVGQVEALKLLPSGEVSMALQLDREHRGLYRENSVIKVDSTLGIDNVLSGSGLVLEPGDGTRLLQDGETLGVVEPKMLNDVLEEWNINSLLKEFGEILDNVNMVMESVRDNQDNLSDSFKNLAKLSEGMSTASQQIPAMVDEITQTTSLMRTLLSENRAVVKGNLEAMQNTLNKSQILISDLHELSASLTPTVQEMPQTQALLQSLLWEMQGLTKQVRQHWLLSTDEQRSSPVIPAKLLVPDDKLYDDLDGSEPRKE